MSDVKVEFEGTYILKDINLDVAPGEIHAIIGSSRSSKSALLHSITKHPNVNIMGGSITWNQIHLEKLSTEEIVKLGVFMAFQFPEEFEDFTCLGLLEMIHGNLDKDEYLKILNELGLDISHASKMMTGSALNIDEARKNELIHMTYQKPKLLLIDDLDHDLEDNEVKGIGSYLNDYISENDCASVIISHNLKLFKHIQPTHVHLLNDGELTYIGSYEQLEGYNFHE